MAATHIEHRFIPTKMQTVEEPVARAKFPIIAAAHHQERFDEENDAAIKHRITNADQRSEISWSSPFEREIPHRKQRGAPKQKSADKARSVQSVIRFFLLHSIALERDSSRKFSTPDLSGYRPCVAVGTLVTQRPPHGSARAAFLHAALTADIWRRSAYQDTDEEAWGTGASA